MLKMPEREEGDGQFMVERLEDGRLGVEVTTDGVHYRLVMGAFNGWRVFGMLAFFLGITLPKNIAKAIKLS